MKKILLVDEAPEAPEAHGSAALLLAQEGYQVTRARSSGEIGVMIRRDRPDLILVEGLSAEGRVGDVARELSLGEDTRDIPVVLLAELGDPGSEDGPGTVPGIRRIIYKPCRPKTFHEGIAHALRYGR
jgi:response regulator RpfG family c-di-GMP phosphodiesterase